MSGEANVFTDNFELERGGARAARVAKQAGAEKLGASVYELQPGARWADLHFHSRNDGRPVPPE